MYGLVHGEKEKVNTIVGDDFPTCNNIKFDYPYSVDEENCYPAPCHYSEIFGRYVSFDHYKKISHFESVMISPIYSPSLYNVLSCAAVYDGIDGGGIEDRVSDCEEFSCEGTPGSLVLKQTTTSC